MAKTLKSVAVSVTAPPSGLPAWVPAPGEYSRVPNLNKLRDLQPVRPPGTKKWGDVTIDASIVHYSGATFAPEFSQWGAWVVGVCGGNSWYGNDVKAFDLSTQHFSLLTQPSVHALAEDADFEGDGVINTAYDNSSNQAMANDPEWFVYPDGSPATRHIYTRMQHLPASWGVSGPKGAYAYFTGPVAHRINALALDLADPAAGWRKFSDRSVPFPSTFGLYPATCRDDMRKCFHYVQARQTGFSKHWTIWSDGRLTEHAGGNVAPGTVACIGHAPAPYDVVVSFGSATGTTPLKVTRSDAWNMKPMNFVGAHPTYAGGNGAHPEWNPDRGCFTFWDPLAEVLHELYPPTMNADPLTAQWSFASYPLARSVTFTPKVVAKAAAGGQWSKLRYVPAFKCFIYVVTGDEVQLIRPPSA